MKPNRILALALILALLLAAPALAAAGDMDDPLISQSYAEGVFRAEVDAALDAVVGRGLAPGDPAAAEAEGLKVLSLRAGDSVTLADGQQLILLSGGVRLSVDAGKLINAPLGRGSTGGDARTGHRYVAWDGARVTAVAAKAATVAVSPNAAADVAERPPEPDPPEPGEVPFTDVAETDWFYADVAGAYARGLVNGMTETTYAPQSNMTLAQAVKLAACMHQLHADGAVTLTNAEGNTPWYYTYAGYALTYDILEEMPLYGWDEAVDRATFVRLFYRALPEDSYEAVNDIPEGAVPDVASDSESAKEVYAFYRAGILTGYTADGVHAAHAFGPADAITRAEVATIMNRMFDPEARVRFEI